MKKIFLRVYPFVLQAMGCLLLAIVCGIFIPIRPIHLVFKWGILPLVGAYTAFKITRKGNNPYISWILPPVMASFGGLIASMGYTPDAAGVFVCAFISIVGAAAGDVVNRELNRHPARTKKGGMK